MKMGTRSVLYGAHCFLFHPVFVAIAWIKLYGFPWHPAIWLSFLVHDIGYIGKPDMDGPEGETHPELGAKIVGAIFGKEWHDFCLLHSRYYAKRVGKPFSKLCVADKLAFCLTPKWLYMPMVRATGEIREYVQCGLNSRNQLFVSLWLAWNLGSKRGIEEAWHGCVYNWFYKWAMEHRDAVADTMTEPRHV